MLKEFKHLVASNQIHLAFSGNDHIRITSFLDIDILQGYASVWVTDALKKKIEELLQPKNGEVKIDSSQINDLQDGLIYDAVLNSIDNSNYLTLLTIIKSCSNDLVSFEYNERWKEAIEFARDYQSFSPHVYTTSHERLREEFTQQYDFALAAIELGKLGCAVDLEDVTLNIKKLEVATNKIEEMIRDLGGLLMLQSLFNHLENEGCYYKELRKYIIVNRITFLPHQAQLMIPYGYLLNVAVKHLNRAGANKDSKSIPQKKW